MRNFRKPLVPLFKVYDIRRNLSEMILILGSLLIVYAGRLHRQRGHPVKINGTSLLLFRIQLSFGALSFPCFKLTHSFLAVKVIHDCRDKRPRKRVDLVLRDPRVVLSFRHSPRLCSSLDRFPPFSVYSVVTCRRGQSRLI